MADATRENRPGAARTNALNGWLESKRPEENRAADSLLRIM
jgi:hypothetical protein